MTKKQLRKALQTLRERRSALEGEFEAVTTGALDENKQARAFTPEEAEERGEIKAQIAHIDEQIELREDELRKVKKAERQKEKADTLAQVRRELGLPAGEAANPFGIDMRVTKESRVYERGNGFSYWQDSFARAAGPALGAKYAGAAARLERHAHENHVECLELEAKSKRSQAEEYFRRQMMDALIEATVGREHDARGMAGFGLAPHLLSYRALSTSLTAGGEFVPPMYLTEIWIKFMRAGRVFANCQHHEDLPDGTMSINIPKVVTGTTVATQGTQNTNISDTDITTEWVTFPVVTFAGQQIVSLQLLERSPIQFDQVIMADLAAAHAQNVDRQTLNGLGVNGEMTGLLNTAGINTITWTQEEPKVKGLYGRIGKAKVAVYEGAERLKDKGLYLPASHSFMSGECWEWIAQTFDTQERPLVVPEYGGPFNTVQVAPDEMTAEQQVGRNLNGLATYEDANIPANLGVSENQDVAIVGAMEQNYLYESPIVTRALPQTYGAQLSVLLQIYNYGAYTAARYPQANSVITGTGMSSAHRTFNS